MSVDDVLRDALRFERVLQDAYPPREQPTSREVFERLHVLIPAHEPKRYEPPPGIFEGDGSTP